MAMDRYHAKLGPEDTITFPGIDFSNGSQPLKVVADYAGYLVVRMPGGKFWAGVNMDRHYSPASFHVYKVLERGESELVLTSVVDFPARGKRR